MQTYGTHRNKSRYTYYYRTRGGIQGQSIFMPTVMLSGLIRYTHIHTHTLSLSLSFSILSQPLCLSIALCPFRAQGVKYEQVTVHILLICTCSYESRYTYRSYELDVTHAHVWYDSFIREDGTRITHMNESWHTYDICRYVCRHTARIETSHGTHITHMNESWHT